MTERDVVAETLWARADDTGTVSGETLPERVRERMQHIVDHCQWACPHIANAGDLPPSALDKCCVSGAPAIACTTTLCVSEMHDVVRIWGLPVDESCVLCGFRQTTYRTMFEDRAAGLSMVAWVCYACAGGELARWAAAP